MKKILLSIGSIVFVMALLAGGTGAFLGDTETSTGNTFASGIIDLKVDNESYATNDWGKLYFSTTTSWSLSPLAGKLFFNFGDIKPGDIGEDTISLHVNNNNAYACMNVNLTGTPENGTNEPESLVDVTTGTNDGELQNNLYFAFWADDGDNVFEQGEKAFKQGMAKDIFNGKNWPLADKNTNIWTGQKGDPILGNTVQYIGKAWCFGNLATSTIAQDNKGKTGTNGPLVRGTGFVCNGADIGNLVQSDGIKADVSFSVTQSRSNSGFACAGGNDPLPPPLVSVSTLFADDFNACVKGKEFNKIDNAKWDQTGGVKGDDWGAPYGKLALMTKSGTLTTVAFNTVGYHDITLKYDRNIDAPANAPMTLTVSYSVDNGANWIVLETTSADSDTTTKTWSLSPAANNKANVKVRFTLVGTNSSDHVYIDNVSVAGVTP